MAKNYEKLIEAWALLKKRGCNVSLAITLNKYKYKDLYKKYIFYKHKYKLNIINFSEQPHYIINLLYRKSRTLIYPSKIESFGMPLLEANFMGLSIIASEKDYVRDLIEPIQTFDPESSKSICSAVLRYIGKNEKREILTPKLFLDILKIKN